MDFGKALALAGFNCVYESVATLCHIRAVAAVLALCDRRRPGLRLSPSLGLALAFAGLCLGAFAAIYALSAAPDFGWHLRSSLPRLLWIPAILLLRELAAGAQDQQFSI